MRTVGPCMRPNGHQADTSNRLAVGSDSVRNPHYLPARDIPHTRAPQREKPSLESSFRHPVTSEQSPLAIGDLRIHITDSLKRKALQVGERVRVLWVIHEPFGEFTAFEIEPGECEKMKCVIPCR